MQVFTYNETAVTVPLSDAQVQGPHNLETVNYRSH